MELVELVVPVEHEELVKLGGEQGLQKLNAVGRRQLYTHHHNIANYALNMHLTFLL